MKKVLATVSKYIFGAFGIAVMALLMSLTYSALSRIFPDNLVNRIWGMVMFDIAAMCWAIGFVFVSESIGQYATAGIGFVVAFLGTLGMVAAEVILSSGYINAREIGEYMVYGFIIVTALHAALIYAHHATAPDMSEKINVGVARGEIVTEAIQQATRVLEVQKAELATTIHHGIVAQVRRDLGLTPVEGTPFEIKNKQSPAPAPAPGLFERMRSRKLNGATPPEKKPLEVKQEVLEEEDQAQTPPPFQGPNPQY